MYKPPYKPIEPKGYLDHRIKENKKEYEIIRYILMAHANIENRGKILIHPRITCSEKDMNLHYSGFYREYITSLHVRFDGSGSGSYQVCIFFTMDVPSGVTKYLPNGNRINFEFHSLFGNHDVADNIRRIAENKMNLEIPEDEFMIVQPWDPFKDNWCAEKYSSKYIYYLTELEDDKVYIKEIPLFNELFRKHLFKSNLKQLHYKSELYNYTILNKDSILDTIDLIEKEAGFDNIKIVISGFSNKNVLEMRIDTEENKRYEIDIKFENYKDFEKLLNDIIVVNNTLSPRLS